MSREPTDTVFIGHLRGSADLTLPGSQAVQAPFLVDASDIGFGKGAVLFSTMHAFKGLERPVVIAIDMDEIGQKEISMLDYAGLSRACGLLRVLLLKGAKTSYQEQAALFAHRQTLRSSPDGLA